MSRVTKWRQYISYSQKSRHLLAKTVRVLRKNQDVVSQRTFTDQPRSESKASCAPSLKEREGKPPKASRRDEPGLHLKGNGEFPRLCLQVNRGLMGENYHSVVHASVSYIPVRTLWNLKEIHLHLPLWKAFGGCHFLNNIFLISFTVDIFQVLRDKVIKQIFSKPNRPALVSWAIPSPLWSSVCVLGRTQPLPLIDHPFLQTTSFFHFLWSHFSPSPSRTLGKLSRLTLFLHTPHLNPINSFGFS